MATSSLSDTASYDRSIAHVHPPGSFARVSLLFLFIDRTHFHHASKVCEVFRTAHVNSDSSWKASSVCIAKVFRNIILFQKEKHTYVRENMKS